MIISLGSSCMNVYMAIYLIYSETIFSEMLMSMIIIFGMQMIYIYHMDDLISENSVQWSAVITRSDIVRYYMNNYKKCIRMSTRLWIHKRHPIPRPSGRAIGCPLRIFWENGPRYNDTALYQICRSKFMEFSSIACLKLTIHSHI